MRDDRYQDQIMYQHVSRSWTRCFHDSLMLWLLTKGYRLSVSNCNNTHAIYQKTHHPSVTVCLLHPTTIDPLHVVISDMVIDDCVGPEVPLWPEIFGVYYQDMSYESQIPSKKFNCFINRACVFRQSWLYQFIRRNQLHQGNVTYWAHDRYSDDDAQTVFEKLFRGHNEIFAVEHDFIKNQIPFKNFDLSLEGAIMDSERSLIIETFFAEGFASYSEKTWRAVQLPRPWILFGAVKSVHNLRSWGFDVFDDIIDHSYDLETDSVQRQLMCLEQLERLLRYDQSTLLDYEKRAQHNRDLLRRYRNVWHDKWLSIQNSLDVLLR